MDAARLRAGLRVLIERDVEAASRIVRRASEAVLQLESAGYHEGMDNELFEARFHMIPCPVLDLESGACLLYAWRPLACRTYGPAIVWQGEAMPHCQLNYQGASQDAIEAARVVVDVDEAAERAYREYEDAGGIEGKTLVARALSSIELKGNAS